MSYLLHKLYYILKRVIVKNPSSLTKKLSKKIELQTTKKIY